MAASRMIDHLSDPRIIDGWILTDTADSFSKYVNFILNNLNNLYYRFVVVLGFDTNVC